MQSTNDNKFSVPRFGAAENQAVDGQATPPSTAENQAVDDQATPPSAAETQAVDGQPTPASTAVTPSQGTKYETCSGTADNDGNSSFSARGQQGD